MRDSKTKTKNTIIISKTRKKGRKKSFLWKEKKERNEELIAINVVRGVEELVFSQIWVQLKGGGG